MPRPYIVKDTLHNDILLQRVPAVDSASLERSGQDHCSNMPLVLLLLLAWQLLSALSLSSPKIIVSKDVGELCISLCACCAASSVDPLNQSDANDAETSWQQVVWCSAALFRAPSCT
jgi:hypothetical protein